METLLAIIGFVALIAMVLLLIFDKSTPAMTFIIISSIVGFSLVGLEALNIGADIGKTLGLKSGIFGLKELGDFVKSGISSVSATAALFIFSILFFTLLSSAGVFNRIINALLRSIPANPYGVCVLTVIIAIIAHLDGSGASSFLIAIPALLPIYVKMQMRTTTLMLILTASMGVMNLLPWGGPTLRVASIISHDATKLWLELMPMQIVGLILALCLAIYMGFVESKRIALGLNPASENDFIDSAFEDSKKAHLTRDNRFWANVVLLVFVLALLVFSGLPGYFPFMIGVSLGFIINYPNLKHQQTILKEASSAAMMMATVLLAAGVLIGVFDKSGIMKLMAQLILEIMPQFMGGHLVLLVGLSAVPMALIFCTDSYFYGLLPIVIAVGEAFGISASALGIAMVVARNCATFISPVVPATLLGCGLSGVSIKEHIKTSFFWVWGISAICLVSGAMLGIISL